MNTNIDSTIKFIQLCNEPPWVRLQWKIRNQFPEEIGNNLLMD